MEVSNWERPVPEGPVYFDAPPDWNENDWGIPGLRGMEGEKKGGHGVF